MLGFNALPGNTRVRISAGLVRLDQLSGSGPQGPQGETGPRVLQAPLVLQVLQVPKARQVHRARRVPMAPQALKARPVPMGLHVPQVLQVPKGRKVHRAQWVPMAPQALKALLVKTPARPSSTRNPRSTSRLPPPSVHFEPHHSWGTGLGQSGQLDAHH